MQPPPYAITAWIIEDTIVVQYPDNQQILIPAFEIGRLTTILRTQAAPKPKPAPVFDRSGWEKQWRERGAEIRAAEERRQERAEARTTKESKKRQSTRKAIELAELLGL